MIKGMLRSLHCGAQEALCLMHYNYLNYNHWWNKVTPSNRGRKTASVLGLKAKHYQCRECEVTSHCVNSWDTGAILSCMWSVYLCLLRKLPAFLGQIFKNVLFGLISTPLILCANTVFHCRSFYRPLLCKLLFLNVVKCCCIKQEIIELLNYYSITMKNNIHYIMYQFSIVTPSENMGQNHKEEVCYPEFNTARCQIDILILVKIN